MKHLYTIPEGGQTKFVVRVQENQTVKSLHIFGDAKNYGGTAESQNMYQASNAAGDDWSLNQNDTRLVLSTDEASYPC